MSVVLNPLSTVEGTSLGRNEHVQGSNQPYRRYSRYSRRTPPQPQQPASAGQPQNAQAARATPNQNRARPPAPNNRSQQTNNVTTSTTSSDGPPNAENTLPINPLTGLPISKRAARRRRARARAAEARRQQRAEQAMGQASQSQPQPPVRLTDEPELTPIANSSRSQNNRPHFTHEATPVEPASPTPSVQSRLPLEEASNADFHDDDWAHEPNYGDRQHDPWYDYWYGPDPIEYGLAPGQHGSGYDSAEYGPDAGSETDADDSEETLPTINPTCSVCFDDEYPALVPAAACTHRPTVCTACLTHYISHAVQSQGLTTLTCPDPSCEEPMEYADVLGGAKDNQACLDRYEALLLRRLLENEPNFVWCKNAACDWGQVHDGGDDAPIVICQACHARACFTHDVPWHADLTCEQYTAEAEAESRAAEERASQEYVEQHAKACPNPSCGRRIEKTVGCDHMTCRPPAGCGHEFCWLCFADYDAILEDGNHRHAETCRHYAAIDAPHHLEAFRRQIENVLRGQRNPGVRTEHPTQDHPEHEEPVAVEVEW